MAATGLATSSDLFLSATRGKLIGMTPIETIIQAACISSRIRDTTPVSLILVSQSGAGKSQSLISIEAPFVKQVDDLTTQGLLDILQDDRDNEISFILVPDFNVVLSHKQQVTSLLISNLLNVTDLGLRYIADGRTEKEINHRPVGLITAVTREMFLKNYNRWLALGIVRRLLPIHYRLSKSTTLAALDVIDGRRVLELKTEIRNIPNDSYSLPEFTAAQSTAIRFLLDAFCNQMGQYVKISKDKKNNWHRNVQPGEALLPMGPYKTLRAMAASHAIMNDRTEISDNEIQFLEMLLQFTNMEKPGEL